MAPAAPRRRAILDRLPGAAMVILFHRLLRRTAAAIAGAARFGWTAVRRIPRRWADAVVAVAAFGLVAGQVVRRTEDPERTVALVVLGAFLVGIGLWKLPQWQAEVAHARDDQTKSRFELENEARKTFAEAVSGLLLVVGLAVTWLQLADDRETQRDTADQVATGQAMTRQGQVTDRFTKAVDQLGSDKLRVRVGAVHALDQLAQDSEDYVPTVLEVLAAFVRERTPWRILPGGATPVPDDAGQVFPPADVQEALLVMGRGLWVVPPPRPTGTGVAAALERLGGPDPALTKLGCMNLNRTDLRGAQLAGSFPIPLCLQDATLAGAILYQVDLTNAFLWATDLSNAFLVEAILTGADLSGADLSDADLSGADVSGANLSGAYFAGAVLAGVKSGGIAGEPAALPTGWRLVDGYLIGPDADPTRASPRTPSPSPSP